MQDLHELPKLRDSLSYLYVEHSIVDREQHAIELVDKNGRTLVPTAALTLLMLGPGTSVSHAAIKLLSESGCSVVWTGEDGIRLYGQGSAETRRSKNMLRQAEMVCDREQHIRVVIRMYQMRFPEPLGPNLSLPTIRGMEGARVKAMYKQMSETYGVRWDGRIYDPRNWGKADPINRAISAANALLNGICHAAIISGGYSPALGFIHTGRYQSFTYDIADLYKSEITIPTAFETVAESEAHIDSRVRQACRKKFYEARLLERILPDIDRLLQITPEEDEWADADGEVMYAAPIWEELLDEPGQMAWS